MVSQERLKLLYVDDDADVRAIVLRALAFDGSIDAYTADSGLGALAMLEDPDRRPDVVLLDVTMPDIDGPATLDRIMALPGPPIPVIFFTARTPNRALYALADRGAIGVLAKPFDPLTLASDIRRLLGRWRSSRA